MRFLINNDEIKQKVYKYALGLINETDEFTAYKLMYQGKDGYHQDEQFLKDQTFTFAEMLDFMRCGIAGIPCFRREDWEDKRRCVYLNDVSIPFTPILKERVVIKLNPNEEADFLNNVDEQGLSSWGVPFTPTNADMFNYRWIYVGKLDTMQVKQEWDM